MNRQETLEDLPTREQIIARAERLADLAVQYGHREAVQRWAREAAAEAIDLDVLVPLWRAFPREVGDTLAAALAAPYAVACWPTDDVLDGLIERLRELALTRQAEALAEQLPGITELRFDTCTDDDIGRYRVAVLDIEITLELAGATLTLDVDQHWRAIELLDDHQLLLALADHSGLPGDAACRRDPEDLAEALVGRMPESALIKAFADRLLACRGKTRYRLAQCEQGR